MKSIQLKKVASILLILMGAAVLIFEIATAGKNYYLQSFGVICLMSGIFFVNSSVSSKTENAENTSIVKQEECSL